MNQSEVRQLRPGQWIQRTYECGCAHPEQITNIVETGKLPIRCKNYLLHPSTEERWDRKLYVYAKTDGNVMPLMIKADDDHISLLANTDVENMASVGSEFVFPSTCDMCGYILNSADEAEETGSFGETGLMCKGECRKIEAKKVDEAPLKTKKTDNDLWSPMELFY